MKLHLYCAMCGKDRDVQIATGEYAEVAGQVRMLMRNQPDHEMICVMGRDRIIGLSDALAKSTARIAELEDELLKLATECTKVTV